jgi:sugar O-acyltransferase (sialic acid O-acetyltransferase NeuD family)
MNDILIIGGGGHALVLASLLKKHKDWNPIGYTDPEDHGPLLTLPYLGTDQVVPSLLSSRDLKHAAIGIGLVGSTEHRARVIKSVIALGFSLPAIYSPNAIVNEDVKVGDGSVIMDGAVIQPGVRIGVFSIINTGTNVDHECIIGDHVHLAPGVTLSGQVELGNHILIGVGARILQGITVTDHVIVGGGAMVISNLETSGTYVGIPARIILKKNIKGC